MTDPVYGQPGGVSKPAVSTSAPLAFDPADLAQGIRVTQADFARMTGVSRQTVSQWVRLGKIKTVYPDGRLDPLRAAREVIKNTNPAKLRAKVFKVATEDAQALRIRLAELEHRHAEALRVHQNLIQALEDTGMPSIKVEYLLWLAQEGRRHGDPDPEDEDEAPAPEGLPLFDPTSPAQSADKEPDA